MAISLAKELGKNPWQAFASCYQKRLKLDVRNPNWMMLVTSLNDIPDARVVLLKDYGVDSGFVFFTNYQSAKSQELMTNDRASLVFYWDSLCYQIRIKGRAKKISRHLCEEYFNKRTRLSQIGAWASLQSQPLASREQLLTRVDEVGTKFNKKSVPCPPHWGGWRIMPEKFEFWKEAQGRLHERVTYLWQDQTWKMELLYP
ncbi:MAG: pyridoxamine 5'-phosphate oxidase [SAR324 cluster bacterium]|nr:pyridoxamine 5'-phosphate oxidase [SAR324 cluster bacterium]